MAKMTINEMTKGLPTLFLLVHHSGKIPALKPFSQGKQRNLRKALRLFPIRDCPCSLGQTIGSPSERLKLVVELLVVIFIMIILSKSAKEH